MARWRYIAQRATTGELLDLDLPVEVEELGWDLSGAGSLRGTIAPDVGGLRDETGRLLLEEWGTFLYAEADGEIRWGGILIRSAFEDEAWQIEAAGFSTYLHGIPFLGEFQSIGVDPADAVRQLWAHVQSYPDGNLGVVVTGDSTPVRLGNEAIPGWTEVYVNGVWQRADSVPGGRVIPSATSELAANMTSSQTTLTLTGIDHFAEVPLPFVAEVGNEDVLVTAVSGVTLTVVRGANGTSATAHYAKTDVTYDGTPTRETDGEEDKPYSLVWWEAKDAGAELDDLAKTTPFDYTESHRWNADGETISHEFRIAYPRLGRRRNDLSFVQGDNVTNVASFESAADDYANEVVGLGAGEGRAALRRSTARRDGRLRRTAVYSAKDVLDSTRLDALIREDLEARRGLLTVTSIDVIDHPNAPLASWELGDDVLVDVDVPWLGRVSLWCRVVGWSLTGEDTASLSLARSDSFTYGG